MDIDRAAQPCTLPQQASIKKDDMHSETQNKSYFSISKVNISFTKMFSSLVQSKQLVLE